MKHVDFKIKILTPLYMFGADQNRLELRESSFKGMMRFWWRALKCCDDYTKLKNMEESIFGGTSDYSGKSKVGILITNKNVDISNQLKNDFNLKWNFDSTQRRLTGKNSGIGYLLYSMIQENPKKNIHPKSYFKPDGVFNISLYSRNDQALKNAVAAFWCAIYLGGFGSRSRRGAGSLIVENIEGDTYGLDFKTMNCKGKSELIKWIKGNLNKAKGIIELAGDKSKGYSNLSTASFIISNNSYNTWYEALSEIGNIYADFRYQYRSDIRSGVFGFPIRHTDKTIVKTNYKDIARRSSPILFKVCKCADGYYWMALRFAGDFLPKGVKLTWGQQSHDAISSVKLLDSFWDNLKNKNSQEYRFY